MDIKTFRCFRIVDDELIAQLRDDEFLEELLDPIVSLEPGPLSYSTLGFVPPAPNSDLQYHLSTAGTLLLHARIYERILPRSVIMDHVIKAQNKLLEQEDSDRKSLSRKELAQLKSEAVNELLPKSHIKSKIIPVLIRGPYMLIGASSAKVCEDVISKLRASNKTWRVIPFVTKELPRDVMRSLMWRTLEQDEFNDLHLEVGHSAKLDNTDGEGQVIVKNEQLTNGYVHDLLHEGYAPKEVSVHASRDQEHILKFVMNDKWLFKQFRVEGAGSTSNKALDGGTLEGDDEDDMTAFDADLIIYADAAFSLISILEIVAGGEAETDEKKELEAEIRKERDDSITGLPESNPFEEQAERTKVWYAHHESDTILHGPSDEVSLECDELPEELANRWMRTYNIIPPGMNIHFDSASDSFNLVPDGDDAITGLETLDLAIKEANEYDPELADL